MPLRAAVTRLNLTSRSDTSLLSMVDSTPEAGSDSAFPTWKLYRVAMWMVPGDNAVTYCCYNAVYRYSIEIAYGFLIDLYRS